MKNKTKQNNKQHFYGTFYQQADMDTPAVFNSHREGLGKIRLAPITMVERRNENGHINNDNQKTDTERNASGEPQIFQNHSVKNSANAGKLHVLNNGEQGTQNSDLSNKLIHTLLNKNILRQAIVSETDNGHEIKQTTDLNATPLQRQDMLRQKMTDMVDRPSTRGRHGIGFKQNVIHGRGNRSRAHRSLPAGLHEPRMQGGARGSVLRKSSGLVSVRGTKLGPSAPWMALKTKTTFKDTLSRRHSNTSQEDAPVLGKRTSLQSVMSFIGIKKKVEAPKESPEWKSYRIRKKLHTLFWTAYMISGVAMHMRKDSMRLTERSDMADLYFMAAENKDEASEQDNLAGGGGGGNQDLRFDKTLFSRAKGNALPLEARILATKLPHLRTREDLVCLHRVMNSMKSFKEKLNTEMKKNVCKMAGFLSCERGRVIFRQGHDGTDFYFIYSGSVFIQVARTGKDGDTVTTVENVIEKGNSFGELALLSEDGVRTATVICRENTELFQIDKESFLETFSELFKQELLVKLEIAKTISFFNDWQEDKLRSLCFKSNLMTYPFGKIIDKDWSKTNAVYYVVKGKILLMRSISVRRSPAPTESYIIDSFGRALPVHNISDRQSTGARSAPGTSRGGVTPSPATSRPHSTASGGESGGPDTVDTKFMAIGLMHPTHISDMRILSKKTVREVSPIILVSQGVEVLRFLTHDILADGSQQQIDSFLREHYTPPDLPELPALHTVYHEQLCWQHYKHQQQRLSKDARHGCGIAMRPATAKGSTGWGRWPGLRLEDFKERACPLHPDGWSCCCPPKEMNRSHRKSSLLDQPDEIRIPTLSIGWGGAVENIGPRRPQKIS